MDPKPDHVAFSAKPAGQSSYPEAVPFVRTESGPKLARHSVAIGIGALLIALSAQAAVPVPFSPVPMTLQPLAVLVVGGLIGPGAGLGALVLYLALGIMGLPVFAGGGSGIVRLLGPTGGYLLSFPIAAWIAGFVVSPVLVAGAAKSQAVLRVLLGCALAMVFIHIGGVAQLALLGGDPALALRLGFIPFLTGDLLKVGLAALLILAAGPKIRALL
ncbi:MAG TPA: biotin transporter BioY [Gemmatimonadales bacterium]|nr:biotin transporter BioY [Gemmatimonadales bacterium]